MDFFKRVLENIILILFVILMFALSLLLLLVLIMIPFGTFYYFLFCLSGTGSWLICILTLFLCIIEIAVIMAIRQDYGLNRIAGNTIFWWNWIGKK